MEKDNFKRFTHSEAFSTLLGKIRYMEALESDRQEFEKSAGTSHTAGSFGSFRQFDQFVNKEIQDCESDDEGDEVGHPLSRSKRSSATQNLKPSVSLVPEDFESQPDYDEAIKKVSKVSSLDIKAAIDNAAGKKVVTPKGYNGVTGWNQGIPGKAPNHSPGDGSRSILDDIA